MIEPNHGVAQVRRRDTDMLGGQWRVGGLRPRVDLKLLARRSPRDFPRGPQLLSLPPTLTQSIPGISATVGRVSRPPSGPGVRYAPPPPSRESLLIWRLACWGGPEDEEWEGRWERMTVALEEGGKVPVGRK